MLQNQPMWVDFPPNCRHISRVARLGAGWSSPVARQAHNLKVVGSNPTPATKTKNRIEQKIDQMVVCRTNRTVRHAGLADAA